MNYLRPVDYYRGNPEALMAEWKRKLKEAAARRKEANRLIDLTKSKVDVCHFARVDLSENE